MTYYFRLSILALFCITGIACNAKTETADEVPAVPEAAVAEEKAVDPTVEKPVVSQPPFARFLDMAGETEEKNTEPIPAKPEIKPEPTPEPVVAEKAPEPTPEPVVAEKAPEPKPEPIVTEKVPEPKPATKEFVKFFTKPEAVNAKSAKSPLIVAQSNPSEQKTEQPVIPTKPLPNIEPAKSESNWIPFVYFYQPPRIWYQPPLFTIMFQQPLPVQPVQQVPPVQPQQPIIPFVPIYPVQPVQPIYVPQIIVPSRFGVSNFVYSNGVVIKLKVYAR